MKKILFVFAVLLVSIPSTAKTIVWWDFEDGTAGMSLSEMPQHGSVDLIDDYVMRGYDTTSGPTFSDVTFSGTGLSAYTTSSQDGYTTSAVLNTWSPLQWTIEISFRITSSFGSTYRTLIGRDGWAQVDGTNIDTAAAFYFQRRGSGSGNYFLRLYFATVDGTRYECLSSFIPAVTQWYHAALVSDGLQVKMYIDSLDGSGYQLIKAVDLDPAKDNRLMVPNNGDGGNWTFGRGWYNDSQSDNMTGYFDDVRFSDEALNPAQFLHGSGAAWNPVPSDGQKNYGSASDNSTVTADLSWNTGVDPNSPDQCNPAILAHYLYMSADQNVSNDPNLYLVEDIPVSGASVQTTINGLNYDGFYLWRVDEGIDDGTGNTYPKGDPNNITGKVWQFGSLLSVPVITLQPESRFVDAGQDVIFEVNVQSCSPAQFQWFKSSDAVIDTENDQSLGEAGAEQALSLSLVTTADEAYYYCQVINSSGLECAVYSDVVKLGIRRLMAHWTLDEADYVDGKYVDISGEQHHAEPNGLPSFVEGQVGQGISVFRLSGSLPTTQSWARAGTWDPAEFSDQMTVSFWLKWAGVNGTRQSFVTKRSTGDWSDYAMWQVSTDNNLPTLLFESPNGDVVAENALTTDQWQFIAATFDGTTGIIYINGQQYSTDSFEFGTAAGAMLCLGGNRFDGDGEGWMNGTLDEVKIYNYPLSEMDIARAFVAQAPDRTACVQSLKPDGMFDYNGDCIVNIADFAVFAAKWLDCSIMPMCIE